MTVASKKENAIVAYQWDLDSVIQNREWDCLKLENHEINNIPNIEHLRNLTQGTLVVWENFDIGYKKSGGRFISPDSIEYLDPESINGLNLYAYCGNDPVNYSDGSGHSPDSIWKTLLGVAVGIGLAVVTVAAVVASGGTLLVPVLVGAGVGAGLNLVG